jgi:PAS domain S-box-containing protein
MPSSSTAARWSDMPFEAIVEQSVAGIYVIQDDHFVYANATWAAIGGYTPQEVIGAPLTRIVSPDFLDEVRERVQARLGWRAIRPACTSSRAACTATATWCWWRCTARA